MPGRWRFGDFLEALMMLWERLVPFLYEQASITHLYARMGTRQVLPKHFLKASSSLTLSEEFHFQYATVALSRCLYDDTRPLCRLNERHAVSAEVVQRACHKR